MLGPKVIDVEAVEVKPPTFVNPLDQVLAYLEERWPELITIPNVGVSGGTVWRRFYNYEIDKAKDLDIFCTTDKAKKKVEKLLESLKWNDEHCNAYRNTLGGWLYYTRRGLVDLWQIDKAFTNLTMYSNERGHARMAVNTKLRYMMVLPTSVTRKPGDKYIETLPSGETRWKIEPEPNQ